LIARYFPNIFSFPRKTVLLHVSATGAIIYSPGKPTEAADKSFRRHMVALQMTP